MLIENLPPDSALHRAKNEGHKWGWSEAIAWQQLQALIVMCALLKWQKGEKYNPPKWRRFPWSKDTIDGSHRHHGDRGDLTNEDIDAWIDSMRPPPDPSKKDKGLVSRVVEKIRPGTA